MAESRDYEELKVAWKGWYEAAGRPIRGDYERFVELSNSASAVDGKLIVQSQKSFFFCEIADSIYFVFSLTFILSSRESDENVVTSLGVARRLSTTLRWRESRYESFTTHHK